MTRHLLSINATSDIHTDWPENFAKLLVAAQESANNALISVLVVSGDVSDNVNILKQTFRELKKWFTFVFFVPGNHDIWVQRGSTNQLWKPPGSEDRTVQENGHKYKNSYEKYVEIRRLLRDEIGIFVEPHTLTVKCDGEEWRIKLAPIHGWHSRSFDCEIEIPSSELNGKELPPIEKTVSDCTRTKWPHLEWLEQKTTQRHGPTKSDIVTSTRESSLQEMSAASYVKSCPTKAGFGQEQSHEANLARGNASKSYDAVCGLFGINVDSANPNPNLWEENLVCNKLDEMNDADPLTSRISIAGGDTERKTAAEKRTDAEERTDAEKRTDAEERTDAEGKGNVATEAIREGRKDLGGSLIVEWKCEPDMLSKRAEGDCDLFVTFSHFLPFPFLNPEKRFLFYPYLAKVIGSKKIGERIIHCEPDIHIFGHTHFGWDASISDLLEGQELGPESRTLVSEISPRLLKCRFVQAPLGYPRERQIRLRSLTSNGFPEKLQFSTIASIGAEDHQLRQHKARDAYWSKFYETHKRDQTNTKLAKYVKDIYDKIM